MKCDARPKIDERLPGARSSVCEATIFRHRPAVDESIDDLRADLEAAGPDGGADRRQDGARPATESSDRRGSDPSDDATPAGVNGSDGPGNAIGEEDRHAVGGADTDGGTTRKRKKSIRFRLLGAYRAFDEGRPVDLLGLPDFAKAGCDRKGGESRPAPGRLEGVVARLLRAPKAEAVAEGAEEWSAKGHGGRHSADDSLRFWV